MRRTINPLRVPVAQRHNYRPDRNARLPLVFGNNAGGVGVPRIDPPAPVTLLALTGGFT